MAYSTSTPMMYRYSNKFKYLFENRKCSYYTGVHVLKYCTVHVHVHTAYGILYCTCTVQICTTCIYSDTKGTVQYHTRLDRFCTMDKMCPHNSAFWYSTVDRSFLAPLHSLIASFPSTENNTRESFWWNGSSSVQQDLPLTTLRWWGKWWNGRIELKLQRARKKKEKISRHTTNGSLCPC